MIWLTYSNSIAFQVSAKTARLIGRENISDVDGAILELVKNGYDADADCVYVKYSIPYSKIPKTLSLAEVKENFADNQKEIRKFYNIDNGTYVLKEKLQDEELDLLNLLILSSSKIIVLDNGCGMSRKIIETSWMNIGTDDKEINIFSAKKHRIKTGAKGIGRFALDKLSLKTKVVSKSEEDSLVTWELDWRQFDDAKLLNQVMANINSREGAFFNVVEQLAGKDITSLRDYDWSSGTAIVLSPIRELWNDNLYIKVNNNLKNINPLGSVDQFNILVRNIFFPYLNYESKSGGIEKDSYDYMIEAKFDGKDKVLLTFDRNEIDISVRNIKKKYSETDVETYDLEEFWSNECFQKKNYKREDFNKKVHFEYSLKEIMPKLKDEELARYSSIGRFELKVYYIKNAKSTVEIIRDFQVRVRKKMLTAFSGVKIYRDNFKVRPYGDEGAFYDWIDLSKRVQSSPAAASHEKGYWRVSPNQLIGSVSISRITNPRLEDTANREGMSLNSEYDAFVKILQGIISKFEYDRQYPLREFAAWINAKEKEHTSRVQEIYERVMRERTEKEKREKEDNHEALGNSNLDEELDEGEKQTINEAYTQEELKNVIYSLGQKKEREMTINQLLMLLSSAGVMAQTFAHEISRVATNLGSRGQHLKEAINLLLDYRPYKGDDDFNPYDMLEELNSTDILLSEWVNLIMDSVNKDNFYTQEVPVYKFLLEVKEKWDGLLSRKYIQIEDIEYQDDIILKLPIVDLHLLLNNFLLNSAYFLEESEGERIIQIKVYRDKNEVLLDMINNGPELAREYLQNPDVILDATESSKINGTGLGLWIAREAVERNDGRLHVIPISTGFMLRATWKGR